MVMHVYPKVYKYDSILGSRGIANENGYIRRPSIDKHFRLNNNGFYGPDFQQNHPDSIFRIGIFGTSIVEGVWANQAESFPEMLNNMFRKKGYKVEVLNLGMSGAGGYRALQTMTLVRQETPLLKLNLALLEINIPMISVNEYRDRYKNYSIVFTGSSRREDSISRSLAERKVDLLAKHTLLTDIFDVFYSVRAYTRGVYNDTVTDRGTLANIWYPYYSNNSENYLFRRIVRSDLPKSIGILNKLSDTIEKYNTPLVVFSYNNDSLSAARAENNMRFGVINLKIDFEKNGYAQELDGHPNSKGNVAIAASFFNLLCKNYIPDRFRPTY
jgi:lysophospholipase L1-like esterase